MIAASPAQLVLNYLLSVGMVSDTSTANWFCTIGGIPTEPDNCVNITDYGSVLDGRYTNTGEHVEHPLIQIWVRSKTYQTGYTKITDIKNALSVLKNEVIIMSEDKNDIINAFSLTSGIIFLGREEYKNRYNFTINGSLSISEGEI